MRVPTQTIFKACGLYVALPMACYAIGFLVSSLALNTGAMHEKAARIVGESVCLAASSMLVTVYLICLRISRREATHLAGLLVLLLAGGNVILGSIVALARLRLALTITGEVLGLECLMLNGCYALGVFGVYYVTAMPLLMKALQAKKRSSDFALYASGLIPLASFLIIMAIAFSIALRMVASQP